MATPTYVKIWLRPAGSGQLRLCWPSLNHLRTWFGRAKITCFDETQSTKCGELQIISHVLCCRLLDGPSTLEHPAIVAGRAKTCTRKGQHVVWRRRKETDPWHRPITLSSDNIIVPGISISHFQEEVLRKPKLPPSTSTVCAYVQHND